MALCFSYIYTLLLAFNGLSINSVSFEELVEESLGDISDDNKKQTLDPIVIDRKSLPGEHAASQMEIIAVTVIEPGEGRFFAPGPYDVIRCKMKGWTLEGESIFDTTKLANVKEEFVPVDLNKVPGLRSAIMRVGPGGKFKVYYHDYGKDGTKPFVYEVEVKNIENWSEIREVIPGVPIDKETTLEKIDTDIDRWTFFYSSQREGINDPVVKLDMQWYLVDGTKVFDNTEVADGKKPTPVSLSRSQKIAPLGLAKAIKNVALGDHFKISCGLRTSQIRNASALGIPPNARLIMDIKVVGTSDPTREPNRNELPGWDVGSNKRNVSDTGLVWYEIKEGSGIHSSLTIESGNKKVTLHYTGYLNDGIKFDSSIDRGKPYTNPLNKFVKGFAEGVLSMKIGGKRKLVIPAELAYGSKGGGARIPPDSLLIFDVELIDVIETSKKD